MEMVTIVDENDNVIGAMDRAEARQKGAIRSIAGVLVFNSQGNVVLQKISKNKRHCPLRWTYSAGGHVDANESLEAAALRELKEELGIEAELESYIGTAKTFSFATQKINGFHHIFKATHDGPYTPDIKEIEELREFTISELQDLVQNHPDDFEPGILTILSYLGIK